MVASKRGGGVGGSPTDLLAQAAAGARRIQAAERKGFCAKLDRFARQPSCDARGLDPESIRKYRAAVDPFVEHRGVTYVDECRDNKQVLINYMGRLRKQPAPKQAKIEDVLGKRFRKDP